MIIKRGCKMFIGRKDELNFLEENIQQKKK